MTLRTGLCLLPLLLATACSTTDQMALAPKPAPDSFAMLPDATPLPQGRGRTESVPAEDAVAEVGYAPVASAPVAGGSPELNALIARYAQLYEVPESLVRRVVKRESTFNPKARNGPYWGLMQILPATARGMGFDGPASALLDAETNLKYAVKYLKGAYLVADGNHDQAVRFYARGYYYDAKRRGMLEETGLRKPRRKPEEAPVVLAAAPAQPAPVQDVAAQWQAGLGTASTTAAAPTAAGSDAGGGMVAAASPAEASVAAASPGKGGRLGPAGASAGSDR